MNQSINLSNSDSLQIEKEKQQQKIAPPSMYHVVLHNDDYTPMDFVVEILTAIFLIDIEKATSLMYQVHYEGKAICGTYSFDVAETKVAQVMQYAQQQQHPLLCTMMKI